ncbi:hypothetical protein SDRG_05314 [Saprolegnia diclina VS20]|uniref:G8 domain-containing protein n=1 Tax=Saprolegnia diclina (strain VS20) TaxID=1156394 RepID=T0S327_SAPDV|nr:hypothetical protein SDRG_05314 [Saprolegnia diclina VS20]EQC37087.1 hypothetical protein SDRG_05314 [Saprolegnia diclina VS20]|eukprot:XP_008609249.1 hypothetical protein SDRG_05314 [Saprolegnia diclina VS20]
MHRGQWLLFALSHCAAAAWTDVVWSGINIAGNVTIPPGTRVTLRNSNTITGELNIAAGALLTVDPAANAYLQVGNLEINGAFSIGSEATPYANTVTIALGCAPGVYPPSNERRNGILVRRGGSIALYGQKGQSYPWTLLTATASAGDTCIYVVDPVDWVVGDVIVIATTDYDPRFSERRTLVGFGADGCLRLDTPLVYNHFGEITEGIDERAEVGLLTRSIRFRGCTGYQIERQNIGGHLMITNGFAAAQIVGVEISAFGQGDIVGRYPIHFHLCGAAPPGTLLRANSIRDSFMRAVTIHGTQNVRVQSNVAFNTSGHAMFLEDGAEFNNVFDANLVVLVREKLDGPFRLGSDDRFGLSAFWITNGDNVFTNNAVAGVEGSGFWIHTRLLAKNPSYGTGLYNALVPFKTPLKLCTGNHVHSVWNAFRIDSPDFDGGDMPLVNAGGAFAQGYSPTSITVISDFTVHHARQGGWFRIFEIVLDNWKLGDVREGVQFLTTGNTPTAPVNGTLRNSLLVGNTANRGNLVETEWQSVAFLEGRSESAFMLTDLIKIGVVLYDGPHFLENVVFRNYYSQSCMGVINPAIGARAFNTFMMATTTTIVNCSFPNTAYPVYILDRQSDGGFTNVVQDASGSISGQPGAIVLPDWGLYYTQQCRRSPSYGLACPHRYNNFEIVQIDTDGVNLAKYGNLLVARMDRDASLTSPPTLSFAGQYIPDAGGYLYHPSLSVGATYVVNFLTRTPPILRFNLVNGVVGDVHTIAVCYPIGSRITQVVDGRGVALSVMPSATATTCTNCFFFDAARALLVFRLQQTQARLDATTACPASGCPSVVITATLPTTGTGVSDVSTRAYPLWTNALVNSAWARTTFTTRGVETSSVVGSSASVVDTNWCGFNDPCLNAIDAGNLHQGILAYALSPCNGLGCYSATCRYCKLPTSSSSQPFVPCPFKSSAPLPTTATPKPTPRPTTPTPTTMPVTTCSALFPAETTTLGISAQVDTTCPGSQAVGCIGSTQCRFCATAWTPQSAGFAPCAGMTTSVPPTETPKTGAPTTTMPTTTRPPTTTAPTRTLAPTTTTPTRTLAPTTAAPSPTATSAICSVSRGDYQAGLDVFADASCLTQGGLGCIPSSGCRFCARIATVPPSVYAPCPRSSMVALTASGNDAAHHVVAASLPTLAVLAVALTALAVAVVVLAHARRAQSTTAPSVCQPTEPTAA